MHISFSQVTGISFLNVFYFVHSENAHKQFRFQSQCKNDQSCQLVKVTFLVANQHKIQLKVVHIYAYKMIVT